MISYVIPTKNEGRYLDKCIESVEEQEIDQEYEIIIVDAGSKDKTLNIAIDDDYNVITGVKGRGKARHKGAKASKGDYIVFVDADTELDSDYTSKMIDFIEQNELVAASSQFEMPGIRSKLIQYLGNKFFHKRDPPLLPGFNVMVKRSAYFETEGFEDIHGEDLQFSDEIAKAGETDILEEKLVLNSDRRIREMGLTGTGIYYLAKELIRRVKNIL